MKDSDWHLALSVLRHWSFKLSSKKLSPNSLKDVAKPGNVMPRRENRSQCQPKARHRHGAHINTWRIEIRDPNVQTSPCQICSFQVTRFPDFFRIQISRFPDFEICTFSDIEIRGPRSRFQNFRFTASRLSTSQISSDSKRSDFQIADFQVSRFQLHRVLLYIHHFGVIF